MVLKRNEKLMSCTTLFYFLPIEEYLTSGFRPARKKRNGTKIIVIYFEGLSALPYFLERNKLTFFFLSFSLLMKS
jgi:hypothetical protein